MIHEIKRLEKYSGYSFLHKANNKIILSKYNYLYKISKKNNSPKLIGKIKLNFFDRILIKFRLFQRLKRLIFYNFIPIAEDTYFINFSNKIGILRNNNFSVLRNNFKILNNSFSIDENKNLIFGEYKANNKRDEEVRIFKYSIKKNKISTLFTFPRGKIRHIHGVYKDPYSKFFYILTGDKNHECAIYYTKNYFNDLLCLGQGDETWRAVSLVFTKEKIYYAMDAEFIKNQLFSINKKNFERKSLGNLSGPVYYSTIFKKHPLFIITSEMCPSQTDDYCKIIILVNEKIKLIKSFKKDFSNFSFSKKIFTRLFLPGLFHLFNDNNNNIYFSGYSLNDADGEVFKLKN